MLIGEKTELGELTTFNEKTEGNKVPVVVLGGSTAGALGIIRDLAMYHIPVYAVESDHKQVFVYSRYCIGMISPCAKTHEEEYIDFLVKLGERLPEKAVLMPTGDIETRVILKYKDELEDSYYFVSSDYSVTNRFLDKYHFYQMLQDCKIPHPKTFFPSSPDSLKDIVKHLRFPCIVKPALSADFTADFKKKVFVAYNIDELKKYYTIARKKHHRVLVQEIIQSDEREVIDYTAYYDKTGSAQAVFMFQRIRSYPHRFGTACFVENVNIPELEPIVTNLVQKNRYFGLLDAEFMKDPVDDTYKLIEINPRAWMQIGYPCFYGIHLPYLCYQSIIPKEKKGEESKTDDKKVDGDFKWIYLFYDIRSCLKRIKKNELRFQEVFDSYTCKKLYGVFSWRDPMPFVVLSVLSLFELLWFPFHYILQKIRFSSGKVS